MADQIMRNADNSELEGSQLENPSPAPTEIVDMTALNAEFDERAQMPVLSSEYPAIETPTDTVATTSYSDVAVRKSKKREVSQDPGETRQRLKRAATRNVRYGSSGAKVAAESTSGEAKVTFAVISRLTAVEDRAASLLQENNFLKTGFQGLETSTRSFTKELERMHKETLAAFSSTKAEIMAKVKSLIDDTIYGSQSQNKTVTVTKHITKHVRVNAPEI